MTVSLGVGLSFWIALLAYVGVGSIWVLAGAGILAFRDTLSKPNSSAPQPHAETSASSS